MTQLPVKISARTIRVAMLVLPTLVVLFAVTLTTVTAVSMQERGIRETTSARVQDVARTLAALGEVRRTLESTVDAGSPEDNAGAADLAAATAALQPLADLVQRAAGVYYVVVTDDDGVRITHPEAAERGVRVATTNESVLAGEEFLGTETGPSGPSLRAKVPVRAGDGAVVGMVAVGVLETSIAAERAEAFGDLLPWAAAALIVATLASSLLSAAIERRFRRLDRIRAEHDQMRRTTAALQEQAHEFGTRLHVIRGLVSRGDLPDALEYIDGVAPSRTERTPNGAQTASVVGATLEAIRGEVAESGARLELHIDDDAVVDDEVLLVAANLCRNAAEAGAERVRLTLERRGDRWAGVVDDDGPGIGPREAERIFVRGYSSKTDPSGFGRGVGLDLVRRAVAAREGTIVLRRSAWGGARFEFEMSVAG